MPVLAHWPLWFARLAAGWVLLTGLAVLLGWALDVAALKSVVAGWVAMRANAALCFVTVGCRVAISDGRQRNPVESFGKTHSGAGGSCGFDLRGTRRVDRPAHAESTRIRLGPSASTSFFSSSRWTR